MSSLITAGSSRVASSDTVPPALWPRLPAAGGSLGSVLQQLLSPGPTGPAIDLDQLLAVLLQEYMAGKLPLLLYYRSYP
jgi:hypothetical protein